jgi:hypothetical protein
MVRLVSALLLALTLALTAQAQAAARGTMAAGEGISLVICTDAGLEMITLGPDGQPASPRHYCPDCLPGLSAALAAAEVPLPGSPVRWEPLHHAPAVAGVLPAGPVLSPLPRGPPGRV